MNNLGNLLTVKNENDEAEMLYRRVIQADPQHATALSSLGHLLHTVREKHAEAESMYRRALKAEPKNATTLTNLGHLLYTVKKDNRGAENFFRMALDLEPDNPTTLKSLSAVLSSRIDVYHPPLQRAWVARDKGPDTGAGRSGTHLPQGAGEGSH